MSDYIKREDEEDQLKFYYVKSIDDYWIGMRIDNFYYADWHDGLGFVWSKSRYLPWGEHVVDENTLWKEHTYPSEPIEIPFTKWIVGFVKKYFTDRSTGWIPVSDGLPENNGCMLVTIYDAIEFGKYEDGEWSIWVCEHWVELDAKGVTAWMPLPVPYREDGEA